MIETTLPKAEKEWGPISVASLGAVEKKDGSFRVGHQQQNQGAGPDPEPHGR